MVDMVTENVEEIAHEADYKCCYKIIYIYSILSFSFPQQTQHYSLAIFCSFHDQLLSDDWVSVFSGS